MNLSPNLWTWNMFDVERKEKLYYDNQNILLCKLQKLIYGKRNIIRKIVSFIIIIKEFGIFLTF